MFPQESEDVIADLTELKRISKEKNLNSFATLLEVLLVTIQNKSKDEVNAELRKFATLAMTKLQEDLNN